MGRHGMDEAAWRETTEQTVRRWAERLPSQRLRIEVEPDKSSMAVVIGSLDYQPFDLTVVPGVHAERYGSQAVHRFAGGVEAFTTAWDDEWTVVREQVTFEDWLDGSVAKLVARSIGWGPERLADDSNELTMEGWLDELAEVAAVEAVVDELPEAVAPFLPLLERIAAAREGRVGAGVHLAEAMAQLDGGLDNAQHPSSLILGSCKAWMPEDALRPFVDGIMPWVEAETERVLGIWKESPRGFHALKQVIDRAPLAINHRVGRILDDAMAASNPQSEEEQALQAKIVEYNRLCADWRAYSPSCAEPMAEGRALLDLEAAINRSWLASLDGLTDLARSEALNRLVADGRFLSGGTGAVLGWMRNAGHEAIAVETFAKQVDDMDLFVLRHRSQTAAFENMINNVFGAFLDSGVEAHIDQAVALLDRIEPKVQWTTGACDYQLACVFARAGLVERALDAVERCKRSGSSLWGMTKDTDLAAIHDHPRFLAAVGD